MHLCLMYGASLVLLNTHGKCNIYFVVIIFLDSLAHAKIKHNKIYVYMRNVINDNEVQGHLSENYLMHKIIARNI